MKQALISILIMLYSLSSTAASLTNSGDRQFDSDFVTVMNQEGKIKWIKENFKKAKSIASRADEKKIYPLPVYALEVLVRFQKDSVDLKNTILNIYEKYKDVEFDVEKPDLKQFKKKMFQFYTLILVYELFYSTQEVFDKNKELRRHLDRSNQEFNLPKKTLSKWNYFIKAARNYEILTEGAVLYEAFAPTRDNFRPKGLNGPVKLLTDSFFSDPQMKYMKNHIQRFEHYNNIKERFVSKKDSSIFRKAEVLLKNKLGKAGNWFNSVLDNFAEFRYSIQNSLFKAGGVTITQIQSEPGKLLNRPDVVKDILGYLKPGDIIWDQTRSKFSGALLTPGFWDHNAIWIGTEKQLKEIGVWQFLKPEYKKAVKKGKSVVEALHNGVVLNNLNHFLNIDDLLVARIKGFHDSTPEARKYRFSFMTKLFRMIGLEYDFTIDSQRIERIVCSSLVQRLISEEDYYGTNNKKQYIPLYHYKLVNTYNALPDSTFYKIISKEPIMDPVLLYLDGKKVAGGEAKTEEMRSLLHKLFFDFWTISSDEKIIKQNKDKKGSEIWKIEGPQFKNILKELIINNRLRAEDYLDNP